jgi:hypothetical protein
MFSPGRISKTLLLVNLVGISACAAEIKFNRDVRPILSDRCFSCHGPDKPARKAKLRLDDPVAAIAPREDNEYAIFPGKADESLVVKRIFSTDPDEIMPPPESHLTLSEAEKKILRDWISQGAKYESHWAFIPLADSVAVPEVKNRKWPRNEIDRFVLTRLEKEKLKPSNESDRMRWLRRVTYDLNGLPPKPAEIDAFVADKSSAAYENVVDRLLKSPRYGERMATPWMDAARYADSYGYQSDLLSPTWPFRDWVVNAFNRNLPYDQFLTEQLAGDLLPNATREQRLATAFNRLHRQTNEGGSVEEEWRLEYVADRVQTFGSVFLGLTLECSRCHDHKFDPVSQRDYYSFSAFFNSIDESGTYNGTAHVPTPSLLLPTPDQEAAMEATANELAAERTSYDEAIRASEASFQEWLRSANLTSNIPGLVAHYTFDNVETNQFVNEANPTNKSGFGGNSLASGKSGQAIRFTGDDIFKVGGVMPSISAADQYSVAFWLQVPSDLTNTVVFQCTEGTDTGFHGTEFTLKEGRLLFVIKRFWPGNAIAIQTTEKIARADWVHVAASYDGSAQAEGMRIYLNGKPAAIEIVRNSLKKDPQNRENSFNFGAQFRSSGLKGGAIDELKIFNRPLAPVEVAQVFDGHSLQDAIDQKKSDALREYYLAAVSESVANARASRMQAVKKYFNARNGVQETSVMEELPAPRNAYLLARGAYDAPKNENSRVARSVPSFLPKFPDGASKDRLGLARWVTQPNHPLTARVAVNRFWMMLFGRGLVATPENLGLQGAPPTHPELLDWLARDFIKSGWDTKALLKKIVLSATYRQDSALRRELNERDPENLLLARGPSYRLPAEMVRDTALAASGLLDEKVGGPPVSPYMPGDLWRESNSMSPAYRRSVGTDLYRRSVYTVWKRTAPMPNMSAFDAPSREVCLIKRSATGTPQQAFVLLNDQQFVEASRVLAEKLLKDAGADPESQIRFAFRRFTARDPQPKEIKLLKELIEEQRKIFEAEPDRAAKLIEVGAKKRDPSLNAIDLAAATSLTQAIMNLDATIWKR